MRKQYCQNCESATIHEREKTSHFIHFIMSVLFFPWVIVWVLCYANKKHKCQECGCVE